MSTKTKEIRITTVDNPYDPFTHWEEWLLFDTNAGYFTPQRLASISTIADGMTDQEIYETIEHAIDLLIKTGAINKEGNIVEFKKVIKN